MIFLCGDYRGCTDKRLCVGILLAAALGLQNFHHFVGGGVGGIPLEVAGNSEDGVAHTDFGHAVRAAGRGGDLLAGVIYCRRANNRPP